MKASFVIIDKKLLLKKRIVMNCPEEPFSKSSILLAHEIVTLTIA
jgi:hypothetical protein